jgi:hypothetical protein
MPNSSKRRRGNISHPWTRTRDSYLFVQTQDGGDHTVLTLLVYSSDVLVLSSVATFGTPERATGWHKAKPKRHGQYEQQTTGYLSMQARRSLTQLANALHISV